MEDLDLEQVDGFVVDLTTEEQVRDTYKFIFGKSKIADIEELDILRREIVRHYSETYPQIIKKGHNVYQIIETRIQGETTEQQI